MSPGATAARVYEALKATILDGGYGPGERLDPARLSDSLAASATPIRDALQRLHGERLVDNARHDGFRMPLITEPDLRDLYGWSADLSGLLLRRSAIITSPPPTMPRIDGIGYAAAVASFFELLARRAGTREHRHAIASLNDRMQPVRRLEPVHIAGAEQELIALFAAVRDEPGAVRGAVARFHQRRLKAVPALAAELRPDDQRPARS